MAAALLIASPLLAGEGKKKKGPPKPPPCPAAVIVDGMVKGLTLKDDQKKCFEELKKEFGPKLMKAIEEAKLTPEQAKARKEAEKEAKEAGKKGKEFYQAVDAATKLTEEQKAAFAKRRALDKELRGKVMAELTDEQKAEMKKIAEEAKKKAQEKKPK